MKHELYTTQDADRPSSICDRNGDVVLALCKVCGGAENSLTEDCPGTHLTSEQLDKVYSGQLDYLDGRWLAVEKSSNSR